MKPDATDNAVTDHAVIRYLERVMGFDVAAIRKRILTPMLREAIKAGAQSYHKDGIEMVLHDGKVITVQYSTDHPGGRMKRRAFRVPIQIQELGSEQSKEQAQI